MGDPGARYTNEFKREAVSQVVDRGYTVREVAKRIGVSEHSLYRWVRDARQDETRGKRSRSGADLAAENARLKAELDRKNSQ